MRESVEEFNLNTFFVYGLNPHIAPVTLLLIQLILESLNVLR